VNLGDGARLESIDQSGNERVRRHMCPNIGHDSLAKQNAVVKSIGVIVAGELLAGHRFDPFACRLFLFGISFRIDLDKRTATSVPCGLHSSTLS
jgi:hypothetical protein